MRLVNGSGSAQIGGGAAAQCGGRREHISSIFAKLGHNEPPNTHRRVAAVLDYLGAASHRDADRAAQSSPSRWTSPGPASSVAACLPCPSTVI